MDVAVKPDLVSSYFFGSQTDASKELVCYVAGFRTKVKTYQQAIASLQKLGYDVIAFEYLPTVLQSGDPQLLVQVIENITKQVIQRSKNYIETICLGVSLGSFIAYNVQKRVPNAYIGAYAAGGVSMSGAIFSQRGFKKIAQAFVDNGYDPEKLDKIWRPIDADPMTATFPKNKSLIVFEGTADKIVKYSEAQKNIKNWLEKGIRVKMYPVRGRGHLLTVLYFIRNTKRVLAKAKQHHIASA